MAITFLGQLADAVVTVVEQPSTEAAIEAAIQSGEVTLEAAVTAAIKNVPKPGGILGIFFPTIEAGIEAEVAKIVGLYTPQEIVQQFLVPALVKEAKALGG